MASLISEVEKEEIRAVLRDVTDTFFVTPVIYYLAETKLARFQEDDNFAEYVEHTLSALVEYKESEGVKFSMQGAIDKSVVKVTLNVEDLIDLGLYENTNHTVPFKAEKDYMKINNLRYKVKHINFDGPLDRQNILVIIQGEQVIGVS